MVFCRYSLVMQTTPATGARKVIPKKPAPRRRRCWLSVWAK